MKQLTVGELRRQTALKDSRTPVVLVCVNSDVQAQLDDLAVVGAFPDTDDKFKIEVARREKQGIVHERGDGKYRWGDFISVPGLGRAVIMHPCDAGLDTTTSRLRSE